MRHHVIVALSLLLAPSLTSAEPSGGPSAASLVRQRLIDPLTKKDREQDRFSRAKAPPADRRVRIVDDAPRLDTAGNAFVAFEVDVRSNRFPDADGESWRRAAIEGCVYPGTGEVFVRRGKAHHPAAAALGKKTKAAPGSTCVAAAQVTAR